MAAKRIRELRLLPGEDVSRGAGKRSTAAETVAQARMPDRRAGRYPFSPGPPLGAAKRVPKGRQTDLPRALDTLIVQRWVQTLTGPFDWANWPLGHYIFSDAFLLNLERQANLDDAAWVCAMVACGLAHEFEELELEPRRRGLGDEQLVRSDGAEGYRCSILSGHGAGSRLDFWRLPSGVIEFDVFMVIRLVRGAKTDTEPGPAAC